MNTRVDLAVIGVGLSGARVMKELVDALAAGSHRPDRPLRVALIDPSGEPGRGVPYGSRSDRRALLIETLEDTRCPGFSRWIGEQRHLLANMQHSADADDRAWYLRNAPALGAGELAQLYLPRHVFGTYSALMFEDALSLARERGLLVAAAHRTEVVELAPLASDAYTLRCIDGPSIQSDAVVLAVGSIPRGDAFAQTLDASLQHRYITDQTYCGSFRLREALDLFERRAPAGPVRLAIIGAAASAIESLYCAMNHPPLSQRIQSVTTISRCGMLPGGLTGSRSVVASDYARLRTSADVYVRNARHMLERGSLDIMPALVNSISAAEDAVRLEVTDTLDGRHSSLTFDLVINCSGAGNVHTSSSRLLRSLGEQLTLRREGRGFQTNADYSLSEWPRVFVAGPLLNGGEAGSDVESISAVFRVARELGQTLAASLLELRASRGLALPAAQAN